MKVFYSPECLKYKQHGHVESPDRLRNSKRYLGKKFDLIKPGPCRDSELLLVHSKSLIENIKSGMFVDRDTPVLPKIYDYAKLAVGSAIQSAKTALENEKAFSLMRPPGHHAGRDFLGGFCYFNNIAIAVQKALEKTDKIAILDIDGHHGNGTQDVFLGRKDVIYNSIHQTNAFPMTGLVSDQNCFNYPVIAGTSDKEYLKLLNKILTDIEEFKPDLIAVSAGFDTCKKDPTLEMNLDIKTYYHIAKSISSLEIPVFAVLEGGYSEDLMESINQFLTGLEE